MQKELIQIVTLSIATAIIFTGCSANGISLGNNNASCDELMVRDGTLSSATIDYDNIAQEAVKKVLDGKDESILLVTEFVDMTTLHNKNKFGFLMTSYVKDAIINSKPKMVIHEINLADSLKVGSEGTKLLTQRVEELCKNNTTQAHYALIGTYTKSPDRVFISVHLVNLKTQIIEKSYAKDFPMTCEAKFLFK